MREPRFWSGDLDPRSREAAPLTRFLLTPFAHLYAALTARRLAKTVPTSVDAMVICVGNISVGGVGKSPVVSTLRQKIETQFRRRAASLSRGYGGKLKGPLRVDKDRHTATDVGDEPLMLAMTGESWIGADRAAAGKDMSAAGVETIIMDDGHQNPALAKDLSFVVVDSETGFGNGFVIPKGPLREPVSTGLARADAVIVMGTGALPEALTSFERPILRATIQPIEAQLTGRYVAFAGIGRPEKLFDTITSIGGELVDAVPFPDHHVFHQSDLVYLRDLASETDSQLITTEKDYARLPKTDRGGITALPVRAVFEDDAALDILLEKVLKPGPK